MKLTGFYQLPKVLLSLGRPSFLQFGSLALILYGLKLWLIGRYGSSVPFWDQWDAEADRLYLPFSNGTLHFSDLLAPHNEHRIFTTRLLALGLLVINKTWNPLLQMAVNGILHIGLIVFLISRLKLVLGQNYLPALWLFALVLFGVPVGWENLLGGFQAQLYFVLFFSIAALWLSITREPLSKGWWAGITLGILGFFSFASGILTFAAIALINIICIVTAVRKSINQFIALGITIALFFTSYLLTPTLGGSSTSISQFYKASLHVLSWPFPPSFIAALIRNLPCLIFAIYMLLHRPPAKDYRWYLMGLIALSFGQAIIIAYGRPELTLSSRYLDLFSINLFVNFTCSLSLIQHFFRNQQKTFIIPVWAWATAILFFFAVYASNTLPIELENKRTTGIIQEKNTRNYLATGNYDFIKDKPYLEIPYPSSERLANLLAEPGIRAILPSVIRGSLTYSTVHNTDSAFALNGFFKTVPLRTDSVWGSYTANGDAATGTLTIKYNSPLPAGTLAIPIAGYPLADGMRLEIEQNGNKIPLKIKEDPRENWAMSYTRVRSGNSFSISLSDSSPSSWFAIGAPTIAGNLDNFTNILLTRHYIFIMLGLSLLLLLKIQSSISIIKTDI